MTSESSNQQRMAVSVVIPAFNEAEGIQETIAEIAASLKSADLADYEIVVVDDGSTDGTREILEKTDGIRVVRHPHNVGYGRALKTGITAARFNAVVITDADMSYPFAEAFPGLLAAYREGFDMVVGARTGAPYQSSLGKAPLRLLLKWLVEYTSGRRIPDINSGLRIFDRATSTSYFPHLCDTFSFTTSMTLSYMMTGRFVAYRAIPYRERRGKTKVRLFRDALRTLQYIVQAIVYYNPMKVFLLLSAAALVMAVIGFMGSVTYDRLLGYAVGVGGIVVAFFMFAFGLLSVLLKQIMDQSK